MNQCPVIHNLSFHILRDLQSTQKASSVRGQASAWRKASTGLISSLNELDSYISVVKLVLAELNEAKGATVEVLDFLVLGMPLQRLWARS